jgi:hypothetical protein
MAAPHSRDLGILISKCFNEFSRSLDIGWMTLGTGRPQPDRCVLSIFCPCILALGNGLTQKELDLCVDASQVVSGPFLNVLPKIGGYPEQKGFALFRRHDQL